MKIKSLLIGMLASTAFVACTNENEPVINGHENGGDGKYVAVNIVAPNGTQSRAEGDGVFENGSTSEVTVNDAVFLFLDGNFNGCAEPYYISNASSGWGNSTGTGLDKEKMMLVINGEKEVPSYIVAILNPVPVTGEDGTVVKEHNYSSTTNLSQLKAEHATYTAYTTSNFVMSNAVYRGTDGKEVAATPVTMDYIFGTQAEAEAKPLTIFVERVVGKVEVTKLEEAAENWTMGGEQIDDIETKELKLEILGWEVLQNVESTLVKNIDVTWNHFAWNDVALKRSYWASDYVTADRTVCSFDAMTSSAAKYVEETVSQSANTVESHDVNPYLVVAAKFVDAESGDDVSLVEWRGRKYTESGYLNFIAGNAKLAQYYTAEGTEYTSFTADLLKLTNDTETDWKAIAKLKDATTQFYTRTLNEETMKYTYKEVETSDVVAALEQFGYVQYWNGGRTYYYTPIVHTTVGSGEGAKNYYGVVRNHIYKVEISGISGYGTPVSDPNKDIDIPEKPTDSDAFLAANVVILDWKIVENNGVELN